MNKHTGNREWTHYVETPRQRNNAPVKIDAILEQRMRAFLRARRMRRLFEDE